MTRTRKIHKSKKFLSQIYKRTKKDDVSGHAAQTTFYVIFAIVPLLVILLNISSFFFPGQSFGTLMMQFFSDKIGAHGAAFLQNTAQGMGDIRKNTIVSIVAILLIVFAGVKLFIHLRNSFSAIFRMDQTEGGIIKKTVQKHVGALLYMIAFFLLVFFLVIINITSSLFFKEIHAVLGNELSNIPFQIGKYAVTFVISILFFTMLYHFAATFKLKWHSALRGGFTGALLFGIINIILSLYLSFSADFSIYGVAGFFMAFLLWFYYVCIALFIGAEVAQEDRIKLLRRRNSVKEERPRT